MIHGVAFGGACLIDDALKQTANRSIGQRAAVVVTSPAFQNQTLNTTDVRNLTDIQLTESANQLMRENLLERFARELHQRLMEMF